eukprot:6269431-Heterocapsa_arctica.AAC.1
MGIRATSSADSPGDSASMAEWALGDPSPEMSSRASAHSSAQGSTASSLATGESPRSAKAAPQPC